MITVGYAELIGLQTRMRDIHDAIDNDLATLSTQIENLVTLWEGAAADGFQQTVRSWQKAAADLQVRLAELHNMVGTAHDNQAVTVRSNTSIWAGRRS